MNEYYQDSKPQKLLKSYQIEVRSILKQPMKVETFKVSLVLNIGYSLFLTLKFVK